MDTNRNRKSEWSKLKKEWNLMSFNDDIFNLRMRQIRLKRLFGQIEELQETTRKRSRISLDKSRNGGKRTKQLGREFSKLNASLTNSKEEIALLGKSSSERKARNIRRASFENKFSQHIIGKIPINPQRTSIKGELKYITSDTMLKQERLLQRLYYGNSKSNINMKMMPKHFSDVTESSISSVFSNDIDQMDYHMNRPNISENKTRKPISLSKERNHKIISPLKISKNVILGAAQCNIKSDSALNDKIRPYLYQNEEFLNVENFYNNLPSQLKNVEKRKKLITKALLPKRHIVKKSKSKDFNCYSQKYINLYQPFIREDAVKELYAIGSKDFGLIKI